MVSDEKLAVIIVTALLYVIGLFPLAAFKIFLSVFGYQQFEDNVSRYVLLHVCLL